MFISVLLFVPEPLTIIGLFLILFFKQDYWSMAFQERCPTTTAMAANMTFVNGSRRRNLTSDSSFTSTTVAGPDGRRGGGVPVTDLWRKGPDATAPEGPAVGFNNTCVGMQGSGPEPESCTPGPRGDTWHGGYEDSLLEQQVLQVIQRHDVNLPLFMFWAPHIAHAPLQAPADYIGRFDYVQPTDNDFHSRQYYHAMVSFADEAVGNVTDALKTKGMWDNTLVIFFADNGGPISGNGTVGANNYPMRGGKYNNFEGGIRVSAFASGGFLPEHVRGTRYSGLVAAWDWYATFCALAGVDPTDHRAAMANLPPIDSVDQSAVLLGQVVDPNKKVPPPRMELAVGTEPAPTNLTNAPLCSSYTLPPLYDSRLSGVATNLPASGRCTTVSGIIVDFGTKGLFKLMTGDEKQNVTTGPAFPNSTTNFESQDVVAHCGNGCLFELRSDPFETQDVAAQHPDVVEQLWKRLEAYASTGFNPHRGRVDPGACAAAIHKYGGFWGPWIK